MSGACKIFQKQCIFRESDAVMAYFWKPEQQIFFLLEHLQQITIYRTFASTRNSQIYYLDCWHKAWVMIFELSWMKQQKVQELSNKTCYLNTTWNHRRKIRPVRLRPSLFINDISSNMLPPVQLHTSKAKRLSLQEMPILYSILKLRIYVTEKFNEEENGKEI